MNQARRGSQSTYQQTGFTLVELAIVLVIIGLLVGAILVGQDLIKAGEIRASMGEVESFNAAATTFRERFNALPGDLSSFDASQYGFLPRNGSRGRGDRNNTLEGCGQGEAALGCETAVFWVDMARAKLIPDSFTAGLTDGNTQAANIANTNEMERYLPSLATRETAFVTLFPQFDRNYYLIANFTTDGNGDIVLQPEGALSPTEGTLIDEKIDDGLPHEGLIRAISAIAADGTGSTIDAGTDPAATGECVNAAFTPPTYNVINQEFAGELSCHIYWATPF